MSRTRAAKRARVELATASADSSEAAQALLQDVGASIPGDDTSASPASSSSPPLLLPQPLPPRRAAVRADEVRRAALNQRSRAASSPPADVGHGNQRRRATQSGAAARPARSKSMSKAKAMPTPRSRGQPSREAATASAEMTKKRPARRMIRFPPTPVVGHGPDGLGYGMVIEPKQAGLEWLRSNESLRALPIPAASKERLVNAVRGLPYRWYTLVDGWHIGNWLYSCERRPAREEEEEEEEEDSATDDDSSGEKGETVEAAEEGEDEDDREDEGGADPADGELDAEDGGDADMEEEEEEEEERKETEADGGSESVAASAELRRAEAESRVEKRKRGRGRRHYHNRSCRGCTCELAGYGYLVYPSGQQFVGRFSGASLNDRTGLIIDKDGVYRGNVVKSAEVGEGVFYWRRNGDVGTGMWAGGHLQYGSILYGDGMSLYTGIFRNNHQFGLGVLDFLHPAQTPGNWEQFQGTFTSSSWKDVGRLTCSHRIVVARWEGGAVVPGSSGVVESITAEGQRSVYIGELKGSNADGMGRMSWTKESDEQKQQRAREEKRRKTATALRKRQHEQRVKGDWSSLLSVLHEQEELKALMASLTEELEDCAERELPLGKDPEDSVYAGHFSNGMMHGQGRRQWANGDVYDGGWVQGICNGFVLYDGGWKNDMEHGLGTLISSMGRLGRMLLHGRFKEGYLHGMAAAYFLHSKRLYYIGRMVKGAFDGDGLMQLEDRSLYLGGFLDGEYHGSGLWVNQLESSVYAGRFKKDFKHGCGRLIIHTRVKDHPQQQPTRPPDGDARKEEEEAEVVETETPELALSRCRHWVELPQTFGEVTQVYLVVYDRDRPVFRVLGRQLDDLLEQLGYVDDEEDVDVNGLIREEQIETAKEAKKRLRMKKQAAAAAFATQVYQTNHAVIGEMEPGPAAATGIADEPQLEREKEVEAPQGSAVEGDGMALLEHYQLELQRLSARSVKRGKKGGAAPMPSLSLTTSRYLEQSLRLRPAPLSLFEPPPSSGLRRIHLPKAIRLCEQAGLCSYAVTGCVPADRSVYSCTTCSAYDPETGSSVPTEVCAACRNAGCHHGHVLTEIERGYEERSSEYADPDSLFYCSCGEGDNVTRCLSNLQAWIEDVDQAAEPSEQLTYPITNQPPAVLQPAGPLVRRSTQETAASEAEAALALAEMKDEERGCAAPQALSSSSSSVHTSSSSSLLRPSEVRAAAVAAPVPWFSHSVPRVPQRAAAEEGDEHRQGVSSSSLHSPAFSAPVAGAVSRGVQSLLFQASSKPRSRWVKVDGKWREERDVQQQPEASVSSGIDSDEPHNPALSHE